MDHRLFYALNVRAGALSNPLTYSEGLWTVCAGGLSTLYNDIYRCAITGEETSFGSLEQSFLE